MHSILFYSILFYSILFYSILFYSILLVECIVSIMYSNKKREKRRERIFRYWFPSEVIAISLHHLWFPSTGYLTLGDNLLRVNRFFFVWEMVQLSTHIFWYAAQVVRPTPPHAAIAIHPRPDVDLQWRGGDDRHRSSKQ